ncbi:hypothetical protein HDU78_010630, partial [Chytriomyces hyalinus]
MSGGISTTAPVVQPEDEKEDVEAVLAVGYVLPLGSEQPAVAEAEGLNEPPIRNELLVQPVVVSTGDSALRGNCKMNVLSNANASHPNANSNMNSNWSTPKEIRFSREALLARFNHEASPPSDLDPNLSIFSIAALEPMANLPLTELEKK